MALFLVHRIVFTRFWIPRTHFCSDFGRLYIKQNENHAHQWPGLKSSAVFGGDPCNNRHKSYENTQKKQLNWAVKACFYERKFVSSGELEANVLKYSS